MKRFLRLYVGAVAFLALMFCGLNQAPACFHSYGFGYAAYAPAAISYPVAFAYALPVAYAAPCPPAVAYAAPPVAELAAPAPASYLQTYAAPSYGLGIGNYGFGYSPFFASRAFYGSTFFNRTFFRGAVFGRGRARVNVAVAAPARHRAVIRSRTVIRGR